MTGANVRRFPEERRVAAALIDGIRELRQFVEMVDDLTPFGDPLVKDNLQTVVAILESEVWSP